MGERKKDEIVSRDASDAFSRIWQGHVAALCVPAGVFFALFFCLSCPLKTESSDNGGRGHMQAGQSSCIQFKAVKGLKRHQESIMTTF